MKIEVNNHNSIEKKNNSVEDNDNSLKFAIEDNNKADICLSKDKEKEKRFLNYYQKKTKQK